MNTLRVHHWLAALALLAPCGCGPDAVPTKADKPKPPDIPAVKEGPVKVAFVTNNTGTFWNIAEAGANKAGAELKEKGVDAEVIFKRPPQGDAAQQKEIIDTLLNQKINALSVSVIDPKNQTPYLNEIAARAHLLTVDNDAPKSQRQAYLGTDNYAAGRAVGKLIKKALPDGATIVIFVGDLAALNAKQRRQGVIDEVLGREPPRNINDFLPSKDGESSGKYAFYGRTYTDQPEGEQKAKENAVNVLTELKGTPNLCLVGLWAYNPPAILSAVKDKGLEGQVKIVAFDEDQATLKGIADGHIEATVVQQPFEFGRRSVLLMAALAKGDRSGIPADGLIPIPYKIITKEAGLRLDKEPASEAVATFRAELQRLQSGK
jgi:ribose transport system substrate-binding protein